LGMMNVPIAPEQVQDPAEKNEPRVGQGRDPERTPMPWDDSRCAGFTTGLPWLPLGDDYTTLNVRALELDQSSILHLYRRLIDLRRTRPTLVSGKLQSVTVQSDVLRFQRVGDQDRLVVLLNFGHSPVEIEMEQGTVILSTNLDRERHPQGIKTLDLNAAEGVIIELDQLPA
jgi:alpha-glucosidase